MKLADLLPKALLRDYDDAIDLLEADHDKVLALFDRFEEIKDGHAHLEKRVLIADACRELTVHTRLEEEVFYPAVRGPLDDDDLMNEALVEHDCAKSLIHDLEGMSASDEMFNAKFTVLAESIRHHIREERHDMFPKVRATAVDLKALGQKMIARKAELMKDKPTAAPKSKPSKPSKPRAGKSKARASKNEARSQAR